MLVVAPWLTQAPNDKEQVSPMLEQIGQLPAGLGTPNQLLADTGSFSAKKVDACEAVKIEPMIAIARDEHHPNWRARFAAFAQAQVRRAARIRRLAKLEGGPALPVAPRVGTPDAGRALPQFDPLTRLADHGGSGIAAIGRGKAAQIH